jgi:tetratricopeptide (TPR) repeat protein
MSTSSSGRPKRPSAGRPGGSGNKRIAGQSRGAGRGGDQGGFQRRDDRPSYNDRDRGGKPEDRGGNRGRTDNDRGGFQGRSDRGDRPSYGDRDRGGDRGGFQRRDDRGGDRPSYGDRERRPSYGDRDRSADRGGFQGRSDRGDRPSYGDRDRGGDRGGFQRRDDRGDRPSYGDRDRSADRGGFQRRDEQTSPRTATGEPQVPHLELPDDIDLNDLDEDIRAELRTLVRMKAQLVGGHLVMAGRLVDDDPEQAYKHARTAQQLAPRLAATREALGLTAYLSDRYAEALAELRAARRMTGSNHQWAVMADCERGLGRPEKALEMAQAPEAKELDKGTQIELRIVAAGARRDLGQVDAAVAMLQGADLTPAHVEPWTARLRYAYADALLEADRETEAREWFARASEADSEGVTDADDRIAELDGVVFSETSEQDAETELDDEEDDDEFEDDEDEDDEDFDDEEDDEDFDDDDDDELEDDDEIDEDDESVVARGEVVELDPAEIAAGVEDEEQ